MESQRKENKVHRGRRKKKRHVLSNVILIVALAVFCVSAYQLIKYVRGYLEGRSEYNEVRDLVIDDSQPEEAFQVDFAKLLEINPDTIGWIRFYPEPSIINYPIVQGDDNETYLHETFSRTKNASGAIFLGVENNMNFTDENSVIYGHNMKDRSMFAHLSDYKEKSFWEENQYFYIYTLDGRELTYHIYSAGVVDAYSDTYRTDFDSVEEYQAFLDMTKQTSAYDTGVEVSASNVIVTLSTCTNADDDSRNVVRGVLESERNIDIEGN